MENEKLYEVVHEDGYIRSAVWGEAGPDIFAASMKEVLAMRDATHTNRLLCDARRLVAASSDVGIRTQASRLGLLWQIRDFDKVAFLLDAQQSMPSLLSSLEAVHLIRDKFQAFNDEAQAIAWLKQPK